MRNGVILLCLNLLLTACASTPNLLPPQRVVVACPAELQYHPSKVFPPVPKGRLTNRQLEEYVLSLIAQVRQEWEAVEQANSDCTNWLKGQGWTP